MTNAQLLDLMKRTVDAFDNLQAAQLDLRREHHEPFWTALAKCIGEADAETGRRRERGPVSFRGPPPPGGGCY